MKVTSRLVALAAMVVVSLGLVTSDALGATLGGPDPVPAGARPDPAPVPKPDQPPAAATPTPTPTPAPPTATQPTSPVAPRTTFTPPASTFTPRRSSRSSAAQAAAQARALAQQRAAARRAQIARQRAARAARIRAAKIRAARIRAAREAQVTTLVHREGTVVRGVAASVPAALPPPPRPAGGSDGGNPWGLVALVGLLLLAAVSGGLALLPKVAPFQAVLRGGGVLAIGRYRRPELTALSAGSLLLALLVWAIL
jgi:hypothetical protein